MMAKQSYMMAKQSCMMVKQSYVKRKVKGKYIMGN